MNKGVWAAALLLAGAASAMAQGGPQVSGQSVTQPSANQATPQAEMNDNQQPANARRAGDAAAKGQQLSQPIPNQNQPQVQTNDNQQPRNARKAQ